MAGGDLRELYQDILIDHSRQRHGFGQLQEFSAQSHQRNRSCGDEVTLQVRLDAEGVVDEVAWTGQGCSISQASASMLSDLVAGLTRDELAERVASFRSMVQSRGADEGSEELLGDAVALSGVAKFPPRINCAMLAWSALEDALGQLDEPAPASPAPASTQNVQ
ncbi:MAG TPA: SUF system NifU family Fe-S cluster assembly protein [Terrimesophilobacter sp.]|nr:SUF system NifU family Fe-S cluster assembly protein [Terrimesophilobacter sp.]HRQ00282.1 SUF system NifU family Fe-S cluster assembly protein [Terrimesophilobacter sp.]